MQNTDLIPICSDKNKYFQKENDKVIVYNTITENSFIVIKRNTNIIQNICSIFFRSSSKTPKIQVTFRFLKNQYNRLVEIKSLQGYHNETESLIINFLKKCIPDVKSIKIDLYSQQIPNYLI